MDINAIMRLMPHRYPFLLLDRVLSIEPGRSLRALKNVTCNEPFFPGHWPGLPVMPGVLILEAMAQAAGILISHRFDATRHMAMIVSIDDVKLRRQVVPGDQLLLEIDRFRARSKMAEAHGVARVGDQVAAEARLRFAVVAGRGGRRLSRIGRSSAGSKGRTGPSSGPSASQGRGDRAMAIAIADTATVDPRAELADGVEIGPYCVVGPEVRDRPGDPADRPRLRPRPGRDRRRATSSARSWSSAPSRRGARRRASTIGDGNAIREGAYDRARRPTPASTTARLAERDRPAGGDRPGRERSATG